jgi:hypothetical protein
VWGDGDYLALRQWTAGKARRENAVACDYHGNLRDSTLNASDYSRASISPYLTNHSITYNSFNGIAGASNQAYRCLDNGAHRFLYSNKLDTYIEAIHDTSLKVFQQECDTVHLLCTGYKQQHSSSIQRP